jgi:mannose-6-phosphate isomerase-like protein (cupin superfamily)
MMSAVSVLSYSDSQGERFREGCERRIVHTSQLMTVLLDMGNGPWAAADPYHSHPHEQTTFVSEGEVLFLVEGDAPRHLRAGDLVAIPSGRPHAIQLLSARARLVDSFNPVREDFLK